MPTILTVTHLVPVLFVDSSTFRISLLSDLQDNIKVKLFIVRDEWLNNEDCDGTFASAHLHLSINVMKTNMKK